MLVLRGGYLSAAIRAVHCNSFAGGFWTDITRTYSLGPVDVRVQKMYAAVFAARAAALDAIRPGVKSGVVDAAALCVLSDYGWKDEFKHSAGHGVGFGAIDAQALLRLHPRSTDVLQAGMVFNLEPRCISQATADCDSAT